MFFSLQILIDDYGFTAEQVLQIADAYLSNDDLCGVIYTALNDNDIEIPEEIENHYDNHCR